MSPAHRATSQTGLPVEASPAAQAQASGAIKPCCDITNGQLRRVNSSDECKNNETPLD